MTKRNEIGLNFGLSVTQGHRATMLFSTVASAVLIGLGVTGGSLAQDLQVDHVSPPKAEYSPYLEHSYPDRVFFGDTHAHTSYSTDAGMIGNRLGPDEAY